MKRIPVVLLLLLLLALTACASGKDEAQILPESTVPGYYSAAQTLSGGNAEVTDADLTEFALVRRQEDYVLTLNFEQTSGEEGAASIPAYTLSVLTAPSRFKVELPCCLSENVAQDMEQLGEFSGYFYEKTETGVTLYFQFTGGIVYKAEEGRNAVSFCIRASDDKSVEQYHVRTVYREENAELGGYGFTPALCDDGISLCRISPALSSVEEADTLCNEVNAVLEAAGSDDTAEVIQMESGAAPVYSEPVSRTLLTMMGALKTDTGIVDGTLVGMGARFICYDNDGNLIMACPSVTDSEDGTEETEEELWLYGNSGKRQRLLETPFASVQKAACSPDGRYVAILEQADGDALLYLYDSKTEGLTFLSAEGLSDYTADFCWGENGLLYVMCGDESLQLIAFDPLISPIEEAFTAVEERQGGNGNLAVAGDTVYFNDEYGDVYAVSVADGTRKLYETADGFMLSPDGKRMLLITYDDAETSNKVTLTLKDTETGDKTEIASGMALSAYVFSGDSRALFMLDSNTGEDSEDYPVKLLKYSVSEDTVETLGALASNTIFRGEDENSLILMFYQSRGDESFVPITYRLQLN